MTDKIKITKAELAEMYEITDVATPIESGKEEETKDAFITYTEEEDAKAEENLEW